VPNPFYALFVTTRPRDRRPSSLSRIARGALVTAGEVVACARFEGGAMDASEAPDHCADEQGGDWAGVVAEDLGLACPGRKRG
jgi:hypothetical protein